MNHSAKRQRQAEIEEKNLANDKEKLKESLNWARTIVVEGEDPVPIAVALFESNRTRLLKEVANNISEIDSTLSYISSAVDKVGGCIGGLSETLESSIDGLSKTIAETDYTKEIDEKLDILKDRLS
mgnify:CR=1 FL=1|tara:strand:- start:1476 stop:1853 length:378 start_codon:yes stop_codon:yes gene_type:complete